MLLLERDHGVLVNILLLVQYSSCQLNQEYQHSVTKGMEEKNNVRAIWRKGGARQMERDRCVKFNHITRTREFFFRFASVSMCHTAAQTSLCVTTSCQHHKVFNILICLTHFTGKQVEEITCLMVVSVLMCVHKRC